MQQKYQKFQLPFLSSRTGSSRNRNSYIILYLKKGNCSEEKPLRGYYKESLIRCSSLSSSQTDEYLFFSLSAMHLLYGTNPFPQVLGLTLSSNIADVSLGTVLSPPSLIELVFEPVHDPSFWTSFCSKSPTLEYRCFPFSSLSGTDSALWEKVHLGTILAGPSARSEHPFWSCIRYVAAAGIGLNGSVLREKGLLVSVTSRVVPKSLRVRPHDSSAASSLVQTVSLWKSFSFWIIK